MEEEISNPLATVIYIPSHIQVSNGNDSREDNNIETQNPKHDKTYYLLVFLLVVYIIFVLLYFYLKIIT